MAIKDYFNLANVKRLTSLAVAESEVLPETEASISVLLQDISMIPTNWVIPFSKVSMRHKL